MLGHRLLLSVTAVLASLSRVRAGHHVIVGAPVAPGGGVPLRLNVNDLLAAAGPQWDLYVQALRAMQDMDSDDKFSYFQTAGMSISACVAAEGVYANSSRPVFTVCHIFSGTTQGSDRVLNGLATFRTV